MDGHDDGNDDNNDGDNDGTTVVLGTVLIVSNGADVGPPLGTAPSAVGTIDGTFDDDEKDGPAVDTPLPYEPVGAADAGTDAGR